MNHRPNSNSSCGIDKQIIDQAAIAHVGLISKSEQAAIAPVGLIIESEQAVIAPVGLISKS